MKSKIIVLYFFFVSSCLYGAEKKNTTLFTLNVSESQHIMLSESIESVLEKMGEPEQSSERLYHPDKEEYNTITLEYKDCSISYWKGFPELRKISLKNSNITVSNKEFSIGESLIKDVLESYEEVEVSDYEVTVDENNERIISIVFRTWDHDYMSEKAGNCDYVNIMYTFDYKTKVCKEIMLVVYDD